MVEVKVSERPGAEGSPRLHLVIGLLLLVVLETTVIVVLFLVVRKELHRCRLPFHGRIEVAHLRAGRRESVEVVRCLPYGLLTCLRRELDGAPAVPMLGLGGSRQPPGDTVV